MFKFLYIISNFIRLRNEQYCIRNEIYMARHFYAIMVLGTYYHSNLKNNDFKVLTHNFTSGPCIITIKCHIICHKTDSDT